jgi:hypothetical protein
LQGYASGGKEWVLDSGCTDHMTGDSKMFFKSSPSVSSDKNTTFGDNSKGR